MSNAGKIAATLTRRQRQALAILLNAERPLRNKDFHKRFETDDRRTSGWAKALGPCTKSRGHDPASLWARGLVAVIANCSYAITPLGREVAALIGSVEIRSEETYGAPSISPSARSGSSKHVSKPARQTGRLREQASLPNPLKLDALSRRAREAVACSYCFVRDRAREWGRVPRRPADRPDDVAFAPWFGRRYWSTTPRVAVMLLNPGHKAAPHKLERRGFGHQLRDGEIGYEEYVKRLTRLVPEWGFGHVVKWLHALGLEEERIAYLNMALCAVEHDRYFPQLFRTCFRRHTSGMLACLSPDVVVLAGTELLAYRALVESMGPRVILSWHYKCRKNRDDRKHEWERVRTELKRLGC